MSSLKFIRVIQLSLILLALIAAHTHFLDQQAEAYAEEGIERTLVTYAIARTLNGVISVAQGTELAVAPAGVGVTLAPGEILDPINDLVERFSWVVMASGAALGVQRLLLEITTTPLVTWSLTIIAIIVILMYWFYRPADNSDTRWANTLQKLLLILLFLRFTLPLMLVMNEVVYQAFIEDDYRQASSQLELTSDRMKDASSDLQDNDSDAVGQSVFDRAGDWLNQTQKNINLQSRLDELATLAADISREVINLVVMFVFETLLMPLIFLWLGLHIVRTGLHSLKYRVFSADA